MRTLSRRTPQSTPAQRVILVPTPHVTDDRRKAERARVFRRRRLLLGLVQVAGLSLILTVLLGGMWLWVHVAADLLLLGTVLVLRRSAIRDAELARRERRARLREREEHLRAAYIERTRRREVYDAPARVMEGPAERPAEPFVERRRAVNE
jgi:hypothetical protein